ncbi:MAG TPA: tRNA guanosine(15) transglycosylase TgtA [Thermoplasmata archaeon]
MGEFELLERDGLARIGRLRTPHGPLETPALLPVVHPDPTRQPVAPRAIRERFGLGAVITSAYITYRTPPLRLVAEERGIHGLLEFDGPVMTDSGAFQQHAYGRVEVGASEILDFQRRIGSDIATVLDIFVEPEASLAEAERGVDETLERARSARALQLGLLAVPVQGGRFPELRRRSAEGASNLGDVLAIGGVVPLMERYRFAELARVVLAARPALAPEGVVHLFGTGHPMTFAFAALFGVDLFDSSAYHKFARRGSLLFPEGTVAIDGLREPTCRCWLCDAMPLTEVARAAPEERERRIAEHNLLMCAQEVAVVRQAIRDGTLWELAERRAGAHPALLAGLRAAVRGVRAFLPSEPESRRSFRYSGPTSGLRPSVIRFLARVERWKAGKGEFRLHPWVPLLPGFLRRTPTLDRAGAPVRWAALTGFGPVPLELTELYPVGCYVGPDEFDVGALGRLSDGAGDGPGPELEGLDVEADRDWSAEWGSRHLASILEFQFGEPAARQLAEHGLALERSRRSGRVRGIVLANRRVFTVGPDGIPRPTWYGASLLKEALHRPARRLIVAPDAVEFVARGKSLFSKFVGGGDSSLWPGSSALLVDDDDDLLAVGRLILAPQEMGRIPRAVAARVTAHAHHPDGDPAEPDDDAEPAPEGARSPGVPPSDEP